MHSILSYCLLAAATILPTTLAAPAARQAGPVVVSPGPPESMKVTKDNTLNGTAPNAAAPQSLSVEAISSLPISIANNFNGGQLFAYIAGLDPNNRVVMLQPDGTWYYPTSDSSTVPQKIAANIKLTLNGRGSTTTFTLPSYITSGRVYISEGELTFSALQGGNGVTLVQPDFNNPSDPSSGLNWSFIELTNGSGGLFANLSFVDFVGLPLGMTMTTSDGQSTTVRGVNSGAVSTICQGLSGYAGSDNAPWDQLCQYLSNGSPLRAVAPQKYIAVHQGAFSSYYTNYINSVWNKYASTPLTIDSQGPAGRFDCFTTSGNNLNCNGASRPFTKPSATEIFGCEGTFGSQAGDNGVVLAATARLCAAFDRTTLLLDNGNVQPGPGRDTYYAGAPTNRYSQLVHSVELDGRGYAFPYDDVNPSGGVDQSGTLSSGSATSLTVTVGGA